MSGGKFLDAHFHQKPKDGLSTRVDSKVLRRGCPGNDAACLRTFAQRRSRTTYSITIHGRGDDVGSAMVAVVDLGLKSLGGMKKREIR